MIKNEDSKKKSIFKKKKNCSNDERIIQSKIESVWKKKWTFEKKNFSKRRENEIEFKQ